MSTTSSSMTGPDRSTNRINMTSMLAGFALGAVIASFAWVQILPTEQPAADASALGDFIQIPPGQGPVVDPDAEGESGDDAGSGASTAEGPTVEEQVITQGDDGADENVAVGNLDLDSGFQEIDGPGDSGPGGGPGEGSESSPGVSDSSIKFGATYVSGGIAQSFLGEVRDAMEAVRGRVNAGGGVHGRQIDIDYKADDWDPQRGRTFIENLINDGVFGFAVSPSSEGLNAAASAGLFADNGVPVVGADGLNNSQFINVDSGEPNPWIWPVATATTTNVHIIMKDAWERGARNPAIVFGNTYRFGVEGAYAFNQAYKELSNKDIPGYSDGETGCKRGSRYCGIRGNWDGGGEPTAFKDACGGSTPCDFILILLEPATALNWMANFGLRPSDLDYGMAGAQPLFTTNFGDECKEKCAGMMIWTGYNPASEFQQDPAVANYSQELTAQKASADVDNQFSMGGYIGMELLVQALEKAGKDLTRGKLVDALNSIKLDTGLTAAETLSWSTSNKYANDAAHGFEMKWNTTQGTFAGFERATRYVTDDWLGQHNQPPT